MDKPNRNDKVKTDGSFFQSTFLLIFRFSNDLFDLVKQLAETRINRLKCYHIRRSIELL